jgi:hypothetical protein
MGGVIIVALLVDDNAAFATLARDAETHAKTLRNKRGSDATADARMNKPTFVIAERW